MNEKLRAMLAGLTAEELAALAEHFCGEMAGHQIMDAPAPVEPTQLDRIERKLDVLMDLILDIDENDEPIEIIGSNGEDEDGEYIPTDPETGNIDYGRWEDLENARAAEEFEATGRRRNIPDFYASEKMMLDW